MQYEQNCPKDDKEIYIIDAQYIKTDETHFNVTAMVEISDQFFSWLLCFGKKAKLIGPDDVVEQFKAYMDKIWEMYESC